MSAPFLRRLPRRLAFGCLCLMAVRPALATDYYLGSRAAAQPGRAVASIASLNALQLRPGDRVFFQAGETFAGSVRIEAADAGTADQPVRFSSYGTGRATVRSGTEPAVVIRNAGGIVISNLDLTGPGKALTDASGIDAGAQFADSTRIAWLRFEDLRVSGFHHGVEIWGWPTQQNRKAWPGFRDVELARLEVADNEGEGIRVWGSWYADSDGAGYSHAEVRIRDCVVRGHQGDPAATAHTGSGIVLSGVDGGLIERCVVRDNGGAGPSSGGGPFGILVFEARGCTVQENLVFNQRTSSGVDGGGIDLDGGSADCLVQYNYTYGNDGPGLALIQFDDAAPLVRNTVRFNISENDCRTNTQGAIYVGQFSSTRGIDVAEIHNNTVFVSANARGDTPPAAKVEDQPRLTNVRLRNNLFIASHNGPLIGGATTRTGTAVYQGNDYWGGRFDLPAFIRNGQETVDGRPAGLRSDPLLQSPGSGGSVTATANLALLSAYQLQPGSPVGRSGLALGALFGVPVGGRDFFGQPLVPGALPIGAATFGPSAPATLRLVNLSVRARAGAGSETLIAGFVLDGAGTQEVLARGVGPGLASVGLPTGTLADPLLALFQSQTQLARIDNWGGTAELSDAFAQLGAFPLAAGSRDAALLRPLIAGSYTLHATPAASGSGIVLIELYDAIKSGSPRLVNVSARTHAGTGGDVLIAGFALEGTGQSTLLVRGVGPSLASQGLEASTLLADPRLTLFRGTTPIATNDNWEGAAVLKNAFSRAGAFGLAGDGSGDAALLVTLGPGVYTAHLTGGNAGTGVALLEVYEVPPP